MAVTQKTDAYGEHSSQQGDLYLPDGNPRGVICLLHGGFWRMPYGKEDLDPLARKLCCDGFAVWNLEYRRVGDGGGWPNTFLDIAAGIDHLANSEKLPLNNVIIVGHSAGGHLALWSAKRDGLPGVGTPRILPKSIIGLAPVADLRGANELNLGSGAVSDFLGTDAAERYKEASPRERVPLGVRQIIFHGDEDNFVPIRLSEAYVEAARAAGDEIQLIPLSNCGHMEFLDPDSLATQALRTTLD